MVFLDKCLFVKILPIRCLRWVLQFSVLHTPITIASGKKVLQLDTGVVTRLAQVWATNDFIRSASLPKQACILIRVIVFFILLFLFLFFFLQCESNELV